MPAVIRDTMRMARRCSSLRKRRMKSPTTGDINMQVR
jgi:hypothetical protein